jgi:hypothetical protein
VKIACLILVLQLLEDKEYLELTKNNLKVMESCLKEKVRKVGLFMLENLKQVVLIRQLNV